MPAGRPTDYNEAIAAHICSEMAGGRSLRSICEDEGMPGRSTVFQWLAKHKEFADQYARAQEDRTTAFAEDIIEIADDGNAEDVQRAKLRVDARKWLMSKMAPKKYGDKVTQELTGEGGGPVQHRFEVEFVGPQKG
tara:strand:- start:3 stop:410 length:408 start_codon:yes stop_codon:yes gene_type:complete